ncbi:MAG: hypothetical protein JNJ85_00930, partial [Candidatus Kapabacteria bacterium]|nr:hypothetical protein [Candidatus Kapabacteria bacterium]
AGFHYVNDNAIFTTSATQTQNQSFYMLLGNLNNASYELRIQEPNGSGSNYSALKSPVQAYDMRYTFPAVIPTVNQVLAAQTITGSSGTGYDISLEWVDNTLSGSGGTVTGSGQPGEVAFWNTTSQITSDSRLFWDDGTLRLGVGTNTPDEKVDVEGNLIISNGNSLSNELRIAEPFYTAGNTSYSAFSTQAQTQTILYRLPAAIPTSSTYGNNHFGFGTSDMDDTVNISWQTFWSPQGNSGTDPNTAFIGTTDNQPLVFRSNNVEYMRLTSNPQLQIRGGNGAASFTSNQVVLGYSGYSGYQYSSAIKTRHNSGGATDNTIDFYVWKYGTDAATTVGTQHGLTIEGAAGGYANIGVGTVTSPKASLHIPNILSNRRVVLWQDADNDHQFYGLGVNTSVLRYQVGNTSADHVFYAGA